MQTTPIRESVLSPDPEFSFRSHADPERRAFLDVADIPSALQGANDKQENEVHRASEMTILAKKVRNMTLLTPNIHGTSKKVVSRLDFGVASQFGFSGEGKTQISDNKENGVFHDGETPSSGVKRNFALREAYRESSKYLNNVPRAGLSHVLSPCSEHQRFKENLHSASKTHLPNANCSVAYRKTSVETEPSSQALLTSGEVSRSGIEEEKIPVCSDVSGETFLEENSGAAACTTNVSPPQAAEQISNIPVEPGQAETSQEANVKSETVENTSHDLASQYHRSNGVLKKSSEENMVKTRNAEDDLEAQNLARNAPTSNCNQARVSQGNEAKGSHLEQHHSDSIDETRITAGTSSSVSRSDKSQGKNTKHTHTAFGEELEPQKYVLRTSEASSCHANVLLTNQLEGNVSSPRIAEISSEAIVGASPTMGDSGDNSPSSQSSCVSTTEDNISQKREFDLGPNEHADLAIKKLSSKAKNDRFGGRQESHPPQNDNMESQEESQVTSRGDLREPRDRSPVLCSDDSQQYSKIELDNNFHASKSVSESKPNVLPMRPTDKAGEAQDSVLDQGVDRKPGARYDMCEGQYSQSKNMDTATKKDIRSTTESSKILNRGPEVKPSKQVLGWIEVLNQKKNKWNWQERRESLSSIKEALQGDESARAGALCAIAASSTSFASALEYHLSELRPSIVLKTLELILAILVTDSENQASLLSSMFPKISEIALGRSSSAITATVCLSFMLIHDSNLVDSLLVMDDISRLQELLEDIAEDSERSALERSNALSASRLIGKTLQMPLQVSKTSSAAYTAFSGKKSETSLLRSSDKRQKKARQTFTTFSTKSSEFSTNAEVTATSQGSPTLPSIRKDKKLAVGRSPEASFSSAHTTVSSGIRASSPKNNTMASPASQVTSHSSRRTYMYSEEDMKRARKEGVAQGVAEANVINHAEQTQLRKELRRCQDEKENTLKSLKEKDLEIEELAACYKQLEERYRQAKNAIGMYEEKEVFLLQQNSVLKQDYAALEKWSKDLKASAERKLSGSLKKVQSLTEAYESLKARYGDDGTLTHHLERENQDLKARAFDDLSKINSLKESLREKDALLERKTVELQQRIEKSAELEKLCEEMLAEQERRNVKVTIKESLQ